MGVIVSCTLAASDEQIRTANIDGRKLDMLGQLYADARQQVMDEVKRRALVPTSAVMARVTVEQWVEDE